MKTIAFIYFTLPKIAKTISCLQYDNEKEEEEEDEEDEYGNDNYAMIDFAILDKAHKMEGLGVVPTATKAKARTNKNRIDISNSNSNNNNKHVGFIYRLFDLCIDIQQRLFSTATPHNYTQDATIVEILGTKARPDGKRIMIHKRSGNDNYNNDGNSNGNDTDTDGNVAKKMIYSFTDASLFGPCLVWKTYY